MPVAFITGDSSGLGRGLAEELVARGWRVFGCARRPEGPPGVTHASIDLTDYDALPAALDRLLGEADRLDLAVLNAGVLGRIEDFHRVPIDEAKRVMEVNLWANKAVLDWLHGWVRPIARIVLVSSGASILGNRGWNAYALSKAALNMLAKLYAHEFPETQILALAPGIVDTRMMDHLCDEADAERFPALKRLRAARGTEAMPGPREAARRVLKALDRFADRESGAFVDVREALDPEAYARLYGDRAR